MKQIYEFGDFRADPAEQLLLHSGRPVPLTPKVFETLVILLESEGRLVDKEDFFAQLWPRVFVEDGALTQRISNLRKVLGDGKNGAQIIQAVPKRGYRFTAPVRKIAEPAPERSDRIPVAEGQTSKKDWRRIFGFAILLAVRPVCGTDGADTFKRVLWRGGSQKRHVCLSTKRPRNVCLSTKRPRNVELSIKKRSRRKGKLPFGKRPARTSSST